MGFDGVEVKFGADISELNAGLKNTQKGLYGLKQSANKFGLAFNTRKAQAELRTLEKQMALNERQMAKYKEEAKRLQAVIANPPKTDTSFLESQIETSMKKLDAINSQIVMEQKKLSDLQATGTDPFGNFAGSDRLAKEIAKTEEHIAKLEEQSNKTAGALHKLDALMAAAGSKSPGISKAEEDLNKVNAAMLRLEKSNNTATARFQKLQSELEGVGIKSKKSAQGLKQIGKEAKKINNPIASLGKVMSQAFRRIVIMASAYKLLRGAMKYLTDALKTNKQFTASLNAIKVNLATAFQPIYEFILPAINTLMTLLAKATGAIAAFVSALFGKTYDESKNAAAGLDGAKKAMEGYGDAAEETKGQLAGFDKFNDITAQKSDGGGGASQGMDFSAVEPPDLGWTTTLTDWISGFKDLIQPTTDALAGLWSQLELIGGFVWEGLVGFYDNFLTPVGTWVFGEGLPRLVTALKEGLEKVDWGKINGAFNTLWEKLAPFAVNVGEGLLWLWENVLVPFGTWVLNEAVPTFLDLISAALGALTPIIEAVKPLAIWLWENVLVPFASWTGGIIVDVINALTEKFKAFSTWASENQKTVEIMSAAILGFLAGIWIYNTAKDLIGFLSKLSKAFIEWSKALATAELSAGLTAAAVGILAAGILVLVTNWKEMSGFQKVVVILGALAAAAAAAAVAVAIFHASWSVGIAAAAIAAGVALIAGTMAVVQSNAKKAEADAKNVPALASGGIAYGEVQALVGDNFNARQNPEVISPLSDLQQMITTAILQRDISGGGSGEITLKLVLENGEPLVDALIDPINKTAKNQGYAPVFRAVLA